ncbi:unnamed protein product [Ceratitis capitata]|uniref:(Mediterranean fruit fly) hypothetical protein n=1 Tax=Ceratitis capitata TaxID=7213 RepID=A0A811UQS2_CERCA|nr:unnamed protein product [Ceratitis capitata]
MQFNGTIHISIRMYLMYGYMTVSWLDFRMLDSCTNLLCVSCFLLFFHPPTACGMLATSSSRTIDFYIAFSLSCLKMKLKTIHTQCNAYLPFTLFFRAFRTDTFALRAGQQEG